MNYLELFKKFYLEIVLVNLPSYRAHFNENNFDGNINELIVEFHNSYGFNPFDIDNFQQIIDLLKQNREPFNTYSDKKGTNIPNAILNTHYVNFLKFKDKREFVDLQDLVNNLHSAFGKFSKTFQQERVKFNGNSRVASNHEIFGDVRNDLWTINKGSEQELQFHIFKGDAKIGYGLGFNAQKSQNNLQPIENVSKFVRAFIQNKVKIEKLLIGYDFRENSLQDLIDIEEGDFILYGKEVPLYKGHGAFSLSDLDFLQIYYDLRYRQFAAYKSIFDNAINSNESLSATLKKNKMKSILEYKKQIILQGPPGTGKTREAKLLAKEMLELSDLKDLENNEQFKLVQFHPSYTYEDFVRGIVAKPNPDGDGIVYEADNKTIGLFAKKALDNFLASKGVTNNRVGFEGRFKVLLDNINNTIDSGEIFKFGEKSVAEIISVGNDNLIYSFPKRKDIKYKLLFSDIEKVFKNRAEIKIPIDLRDKEKDYQLKMKGKYPYYYMILKMMEEIDDLPEVKINLEIQKNYILIIDEINRANLSSVLGELIYALEYRNEAVESMYELDGSNQLTLPPNLFIIGTMNTADRSVGHIDYAIRRRFAFVDILPENLKETQGLDSFDDVLFNKVASLFETNLSQEFNKEDVQLGHSYFIDKSDEGGSMDIRLEYEIKPILLEYVRDGILIGKTREGGSEMDIATYIKSL
jgi:MoxR-like ATPase